MCRIRLHVGELLGKEGFMSHLPEQTVVPREITADTRYHPFEVPEAFLRQYKIAVSGNIVTFPPGVIFAEAELHGSGYREFTKLILVGDDRYMQLVEAPDHHYLYMSEEYFSDQLRSGRYTITGNSW